MFLDSIVTHLPAMLFVKDSATREYMLLNKAGEDVIGKPAADVIGKTDQELFPQLGDAFHRRDTSVLKSAGVESHESDFTRDDGTTVTLRTKRVVIEAPEAAADILLVSATTSPNFASRKSMSSAWRITIR